jgi:hypothetical protein
MKGPMTLSSVSQPGFRFGGALLAVGSEHWQCVRAG